MNRGILTYLRTSAALRVFSALALVALTVTSVAVGVCSSCPVMAEKTSQQESCSMSQDNEEINAKEASCCCSAPAEKTVKKMTIVKRTLLKKASSESCCSAKLDNNLKKYSANNNLASQPVQLIDNSIQAPKVRAEQSTCKHSGPCSNQMQTDSQSTSPPPLRSIEQERQDNFAQLIQTPAVLLAIKSLTQHTSLFSCEPSMLSGIGSQMLLC